MIERFDPISLSELDRRAQLLTRHDRKYLIDRAALTELLDQLPVGVRALDFDGRRWSSYASTYYDTLQLDSYRLAATKRRNRFKVRTRRYVDIDVQMAEVKTKDRSGRTVKERIVLDDLFDLDERVCDFAARFDVVAPFASRLEPVLLSTYRRATLVLPDDGGRITIDDSLRAFSTRGQTGLTGTWIVETKSPGRPSIVDRALWRAGHRPVKFSKYTTTLAAIDPRLPSNRWRRVLVDHFDHQRPGHRITSLRRFDDRPIPALEGVLS